jgi:murein DD-endopeptidase MepM/ murein hydrolase activator NlpD
LATKTILAGVIGLSAIVFIGFMVGNGNGEKLAPIEHELISMDNLEEIEPLPPRDPYGFILDDEDLEITESRIRRNENLYLILRGYGLSPLAIHNIQQAASGIANLHRMQPGQNYRIYKRNGNPFAMVWHHSLINYTVFYFDEEDEYLVERGSIPIEYREAETAGVITSSLYETVRGKGASQRLGVELAEVFGWEIDFFALRNGDHFKVIYDNTYANGEYLGIGDIKAAEFQHRGRTVRAYYFDNGYRRGYFDAEGNSMEKELLMAPFRYSQRISSGFSANRFHPILNERRPHYGTDYAAPTGTPIISVGDGVVTEARYRGGNGNIVQIRHNDQYRTAYLHLNRFASGIRPGARVEQGQVIGYVGQTGLATGPHLCYRLYVHDRPINSVTADLPSADSLDEEYMGEFLPMVEYYDERLDGMSLEEDLALR